MKSDAELISKDYLKQNRLLHNVPTFGAGGWKYLETIEKLVIRNSVISILDYGAGKGTLKRSLKRRFPFIPVQNYDPVTYPEMPAPAELVVCTDVLEHIEPEHLEDVLQHLRALTQKIAFFSICCRPAKKSLPDGRNAHLIIQPPDWWKEQLSDWEILEWDQSPHDVEVQLR